MLFRSAREACRRLARSEEFPRQWLESKGGARQPARGCGRADVREHRLVAQVHAVEAADGERSGRRRARVAEDLHVSGHRCMGHSWREKSRSLNPITQREAKYVAPPATITSASFSARMLAEISNHDASLPIAYQSAPAIR